MKKKIITSCCFAILSLQLWANNDPILVQDGIEPPPPPTPIDSFLPLTLFIAVAMVGYYFNRKTKALLKNK